MNFSFVMPAFLNMAWSVPFLRGLLVCTGTGMVILPDREGSLFIHYKFKFLFYSLFGKVGNILNN
ncbi:hypothetical protein BMS3Bbin05_02126 [bacterium BMS3Bbin05]|nr:hypothetical protein BMS3Bbin05_02126 [bacterium BMS3Bbin05]